jgi:hypothetical protein
MALRLGYLRSLDHMLQAFKYYVPLSLVYKYPERELPLPFHVDLRESAGGSPPDESGRRPTNKQSVRVILID